MSGELFPDAPVPAPAWRTVPGLYGTSRTQAWIHESGARVAHCGHPTALRPYWCVRADGTEVDRKLRTLEQAKAAALGQPVV